MAHGTSCGAEMVKDQRYIDFGVCLFISFFILNRKLVLGLVITAIFMFSDFDKVFFLFLLSFVTLPVLKMFLCIYCFN